jgi:hypothetical protein
VLDVKGVPSDEISLPEGDQSVAKEGGVKAH